MDPSGRRASSPGPGLSKFSRPSSPTTSEPVSLADTDGSLSRSWHSWHRNRGSSQRSPSGFDLDWDRTRLKVTKAVGSIIQVVGDEILPIAAEALSVVPIPALAPAAKILDSIWKSVNNVQIDRSACFRLTDRCASLLIEIQEAVSTSGDAVAHQLEPVLEKLQRSFSDIDLFVKNLVKASFTYRYIKREEIHQQILDLNQGVNDCLTLFYVRLSVSHVGVSLANMAISERILQQMVTPAQVSMLIAQDQTHPPPPISESDPEMLDLNLTNFPTDATPETLQGDISSFNEKLHEIQQVQNEFDLARDADDLRRVLRSVLDAPNNRTVTRILQIPSPDMPVPAMMTALLRELERQQREPLPQTGSSPSPRIRTLTWPVDGIPARQAALLDKQFVELALEALKRAAKDYDPSDPSLITGAFGRVQVLPPSSRNSSRSEIWSERTGITTPLSANNSDLPPHDLGILDDLPIDPSKAATEIRYRMSLSHAFHHLNVTLPLWTPSLVQVGAVGYLEKPTGAFRTLFDCRDPVATSNGRLSEISGPPSLPIVIQKPIVLQKPKQEGLQTKKKFMDRLKPKNQTTFMVKRSYPISALGETAHLIAEDAEHQYFERLDELKKWFRANLQAIVDAYHPECLREELLLVVGTLNTRDHALFVNHGGEDAEEAFETRFHVLSSPRQGQTWGYFEPFPNAGTEEATRRICKISTTGSGRSTVLLSRLRFLTDEREATTH
ncbi:hypothetical protein K438DRAFT_1798039 [Mycena galopus ATCC 62051]|nr:hypothetical protein K438DRAFT_1798039 [Mycena galopus ATCC 62051]